MNIHLAIKRLAFLCFIITFFTVNISQLKAATITSAATGNWSNANTWAISLTRPGTVTATAGSTSVTGTTLASFTTTLSVGSQILNTSNVVIGTVASIQSATSLTLTSGAAASMTNAGWNSRGVGPGDAVTISSGHTVTVDGNYTCASVAMSTAAASNTLTISSTNILNVTGAFTMARPNTGFLCTLNVNAGTLNCGSLTMSATTSTRNDNINITTGILNCAGNFTTGTTGCVVTISSSGTLEMGGTTVGSFTLSPGTTSTVVYDAAGAQTVKPATYNNLKLGGTSLKTTASVTVNGTLTIEGSATMSAAATMGASSGIVYNTSTARTSSNFEWPASFSGTGGVTISNTGAITMNAAKVFSIGSELVINSGATLNTGNFSIDLGGDYINNGGTFNAGSSNINIAGTAATQSIAGFTTTGTVTLTKTSGTATFTGDVTSGPLTLNGTGGNLSCGVGRTHTFTKFTRGPGTLLGGSSIINITDSAFLSTGSFTAETSTVRWISNEAAQDISSVTYYNVEFGGSSVKTTYTFTTINNNFLMSGTASTTASANLSVGGNFTIGDGNVYNTAAFSLSVTGTTTIGTGTGGSLDINASTTSVSFGNLIVNAGGTITNDANLSYTIAGNLTNNGNYNSGTNTITFSGANKVIDGSSQTNFSNLNITGSYTLNSILEYTGTLTGASGTLTMGSTGELKINSATNPSVTNFNTSTSGNTVHYNLAGAQSILAKSYHHLKLNTSGIKTFTGNTSIAGDLDLLSTADIDASTFTITLKGNLTTSSGTSGITLNAAKIVLDGSSTQNINVSRTIGFRPKKLFISNSEKIINTSQTVVSDTTSFASGSIYNGANSIVNTFTGVFTGTGTFKFGSCAIPCSSILSLSYTGGNTTVFNFESSFNQLAQIVSNPGVGNTVTFQNDIIISSNLNLFSGIATFNAVLSLDGNLPITDNGGKMFIATTGSLRFGNCVTTGTATNIPNGIFSSAPTVKNLTINRANGMTLGNQMISVSDVLTMSSGNLATNNSLTLLSTSTKTARVAPITNGSVISGDVVVNRFIPGGSNKRKWRLLSSPVNVSGSIALSQFKDDIFVTAPAGTGGGFDNSPNNNASIRTYTESTTGASSLGWTNPTNITNTVTTGTGLEVFVRGSRNLANPFLNWTVPDDVTIDYIGALNTGNFTKSLSYTPSTGGATTADGFNLVGNPYASPINFDTTAGWTKTNIENKFWCYNPTSSNYGIYDAVAHTGTNGITRYIASGQAFFVRATSASSPSITFTENVKCVQAGNSYFKSNKVISTYPILRMTLESDSSEYDEALVLIDSANGSMLATDERDAAKFFNDALNIYTVTKDKSNLAINAINIPSINDTINVSVWSYDSTAISTKQHKIKFAESETIDPSIDIYLLDQFLNTIINVRNTNEYNFMITSDVNSYGNNRFKLLFNNLGNGITEQANNTDIILYPNPAQNNLFFKLNNERSSILKYDILDLMGRIIESSEIDVQNTLGMINIDKLNAGNYIIRMTLGEKQFIKKFIKQ